jgi:hypothetical protein
MRRGEADVYARCEAPDVCEVGSVVQLVQEQRPVTAVEGVGQIDFEGGQVARVIHKAVLERVDDALTPS